MRLLGAATYDYSCRHDGHDPVGGAEKSVDAAGTRAG